MPNHLKSRSTFLFEDDISEHDLLFPLQGPSLVNRVENNEVGSTNSSADGCFHENYTITDLDNSQVLNCPTHYGQANQQQHFSHHAQNSAVSDGGDQYFDHSRLQKYMDIADELLQKSLISLPSGEEPFSELTNEDVEWLSTSETDNQSNTQFPPNSQRSDTTDSEVPEDLKITDKDFEWSDDEKLDEGSDSEISEDLKITEKDIEWYDDDKTGDFDSDIPEELKITDKDLEWSDDEKQDTSSPGEGTSNRDKTTRKMMKSVNQIGKKRKTEKSSGDKTQAKLSKRNVDIYCTGEKPYSCDKCDYKARQASTLDRHKRTHTGEKPYSCDKCDYKARQAGHLNKHKRTHTGEKPYSCDKCDYKARQVSTLNQHKRTHSGEKPYAHDLCDYRTTQASALKAHKRTHTGEKPYGNHRTACKRNVTQKKSKSLGKNH